MQRVKNWLCDLPQVGEWAKYGDALYRVVSVGAYNNKNIPLPLVTVDHNKRKDNI